jgi:hypothetical protein
MPWWFYLVAIPTALLLTNGIPHFTQGIAGKPFPSPRTGGPGRDDTPVANVLWGGANLIVGGILLWIIRDGLGDIWMIVEMVVIGLVFATLLGTAFGNPARWGRKR